MATIIWTDIAQSNLIEIRTYIALSSLLQADLLIDALLTKARMLERYPEAGKIIKEVPRSNYRELLFKNTASFTEYRMIWFTS